MIDITQAILSLDSNAQFTVSGSPSNEAEYQAQVKYVTGADENGSAIFSDTQPWTWAQVSAKKTELENAEPLRKLREQRDLKFKDEVDPISLKYLSTGQSIPSAWTTYANALRDLPANYSTSDSAALSADLSNLVWPTKPE